MIVRARVPLTAAFVCAAILCAACGGGSSGGPGASPIVSPPPTPTPTPFPTFTQGPTPPPACPERRNPVTVPLAVATPIPFPNVDDYCGQIVFPSGSSPVAGNRLTLATQITYPQGYPPQIPPGVGNYGVGAGAVLPWLTFSLSESLNTQGQDVSLTFVFPQSPHVGFYYVGVFDLTLDPHNPFLTYPTGISNVQPCIGGGSSPSGSARMRNAFFHVGRSRAARMRLRLHPDDVIGGDSYYFGLFEQTTQSIQQAGAGVDAAGGSFKVPETEGFKASVPYGPPGGGGSAQMLLTSSVVDCTYGEVPPLQTTGTPVFYESFILSSPVALNFQSTRNATTLISQSIQPSATYDVYWYDVTNVSPSTPATLLLHTPSIPGGSGILAFPTVFSDLQFDNSHTIMLEVVKD